MLQQLTARVAAENHKEAALQCMGFDTVPDEYRRIVKDIAVQAVRNAIVHGIESTGGSARTPASRRRAQLKLIFQDLGDAGYKLIAEDDGQGLSTERIKEAALKKGFITPEKAATLDAKQVFSLLFQPGFSTVETATKDAGRGVGMNLMAGLMQQIGGKVSVGHDARKIYAPDVEPAAGRSARGRRKRRRWTVAVGRKAYFEAHDRR